MAYTPARLYQGQAAVTETTLYTASGSGCLLKEVVACNTTHNSATFNLSLVPSGGTAGNSNRIMYQTSLDGGQTVILDMSQAMASGDFLSAIASAGSSITLTISGVIL